MLAGSQVPGEVGRDPKRENSCYRCDTGLASFSVTALSGLPPVLPVVFHILLVAIQREQGPLFSRKFDPFFNVSVSSHPFLVPVASFL